MKNYTKTLRKSLYGLRRCLLGAVIASVLVAGCGTIKYVPVESQTQVTLRDSTVYHVIDSIRITEATRYKDMAWLGDTLKLVGSRSSAWAFADTTKEVLTGGLEEKPVETRTKIIYKDRNIVKDSLVYVDRPVPVEIRKEVKVIPKFWKFTGIVGILFLIGLLTITGWKVYGFFKFRK